MIRQLVNQLGTYVEIEDTEDPELVETFLNSNYTEWDGETPIPLQQAEIDFRQAVAEMQLNLDAAQFVAITGRGKDRLVPRAGLCRMYRQEGTGRLARQEEPDDFADELARRRIKRRTL